ncbi:MAG: ABC transporter ATP-binding protein [Deltaproteobacteria bacterium]|nr:ABC transporter ATP-binding protein [Deltaproteobacteria bacterium]
MQQPCAIELMKVGKRFGRHWAIADLTLALQDGEAVALFGGNGSGKSTLLRLIAAVHAPTAGCVRVGGVETMRDRLGIRRRIRFLPHEKQLYGALTVRENLRLAAGLRGERAVDRRIAAALERLEMLPAADRRVAHLSEGMKKRVVIARLLLGPEEPSVILLDEPHPALDSAGRAILNALIREWRRSGKTLLLASHDHAEALAHADRAVVLERGRLASDTPVPCHAAKGIDRAS